jgi:hypothetical protein
MQTRRRPRLAKRGPRVCHRGNRTKTECLDECLDLRHRVSTKPAKSLKPFGGEYRNRTGVHGFARLGMWLKMLTKVFRLKGEIGGTIRECLDRRS